MTYFKSKQHLLNRRSALIYYSLKYWIQRYVGFYKKVLENKQNKFYIKIHKGNTPIFFIKY